MFKVTTASRNTHIHTFANLLMLIIVCSKSCQIYCSALDSSRMVLYFVKCLKHCTLQHTTVRWVLDSGLVNLVVIRLLLRYN